MRAPHLAPMVALGGVLSLCAQAPEVRISGGSLDDQVIARAAFGRPAGLEPASLEQGRAAILATDRFRSVQTSPEGGGWVSLDPWPALRETAWRGDKPPRPLLKTLMPSLRPGIRVGDRRKEAWRLFAETRLREAGYPEARVEVVREDEDRRMAVTVNLGGSALVQRIEWAGGTAGYGPEKLLDIAGIRPGKSLWTELLNRQAQAALRKRFMKDRRYQGAVEFEWLGAGVLKVNVQPGPLIQVAFEGEHLPLWGLREWVPLVRAGRFSQELYEEGDRRLLRHFLEEGYLDAQISHRTDALRGTPEKPEEIRVTYVIHLGPKVRATGLSFEGDHELSERDLRKAADLPSRTYYSLWLKQPEASPDLLAEVEARVKAFYFQRGFPDARVRRRLERKGDKTKVTLVIREGERKDLRDLELELPKGSPWAPMDLGEALLRVLGEPFHTLPEGDGHTRRFRGDRSGTTGTVRWIPSEPSAKTERVALRLDPPIRFVKNDLAPVLTALRQKVAALGSPRPVDHLDLEAEDGRMRVRITLPPQPVEAIRRLSIFGADDTRAEVLVREAHLVPGDALDPKTLAAAQGKIGNLRAFQRVDLLGLQDLTPPPPAGPNPWQPGDLILGLEERSPWAFSGGFGYDKSQGYHFSGGVQRLNLWGGGESLDLGVRAGDAFLNSEPLRKAFPTGEFSRSLDSFGVTYTDPSLGLNLQGIAPWLPDRALYRSEWTYIEELQTIYQIHRRRVLNDFEWRIDAQRVLRAGHRYERVEVATLATDFNNDEFLNKTVHSPGRAVISAPFIHYLRDGRDNAFDPTRGTYFSARVEFANQVFGTSANSSFVKLDLRHQWLWPVGVDGKSGVLAAGVRVGVARPTSSSANELPLSERFFAGGPFTHRGVEPDYLGPVGDAESIDPKTHLVRRDIYGNPLYQPVPLGGQAMALVNLEYRFPILGQWAGEVFVDSGQVYKYLQRPSVQPPLGSDAAYPPFLTALGLGLMYKVGIPIKIEYAMDVRRLLGKPRSQRDRENQLKGLLISAGFQF